MKPNAMAIEFILFAAKEKYMEKEGDRWCVLCALGNAKADFDDLHPEYGMPIRYAMTQVFIEGITETDYDKPLADARDYLLTRPQGMLFDTKGKALSFMRSSVSLALNKQEGK